MIMNKEIGSLFLSKLLERVGPKEIAHEAVGWWFPEAVNLRQQVSES